MSGPPDDQDPTWQDLRDQVERALSDAGLAGAGLDETVLEGIREAFAAIDQLTGGGQPGPDASPAPPGVHVMEGGRSDAPADGEADPTASDRARPDLRLAPEPGAPAAARGAKAAQTLDPDVRISVKRVGDLSRTVRRAAAVPDIRRRGAILVKRGLDQVLYRGAETRLYRVSCTQGLLRIELDGKPVGELLPGQATDVEARLLRVHGEQAEESTGSYALVKQP